VALTDADRAHLERCLELAERGRRTAAPNPLVGATVVRDGQVLGEGWHRRTGEPHAEIEALLAAGDAREATVYVSLEPCCHQGRTPPCTDALLAAGVGRVVIGALDPFPEVNGRGVRRLRDGGVAVEVADGELERRARRQNAGFRTLVTHGRPYVVVKAAASLDGRTATAAGESQWISSPASRRRVHDARADAGAVAVGIGTVLADDPLLTARDATPPPERQPLRVVFDRRARLPLDSRLARSVAAGPVLVVAAPDAPADRLRAAGIDVAVADGIAAALAELGRRGIATVLVEGGASLAGAFLRDGLVDRIDLYLAPILLGGGPGIAAGWAAPALADAPRALHVEASRSGDDILLEAELREP
jgi:diaminohydroxyphosphoribosylaminopyrimidine deaminase / 5-amino-6-(5-phosphoribosylamino)uracil reductase